MSSKPTSDRSSSLHPRSRSFTASSIWLWLSASLLMACAGGGPSTELDAGGDGSVVAVDGGTEVATPRDMGNTPDLGRDLGNVTLDSGTVGPIETVAWVMSYFRPEQNQESDSLHLAYSTDGLHWTTLNGGASVYKPTGIGTNQIRDPFILRKQDGTFVYIATDWTRNANPGYWSNPSPYLFVAESTDLITFTNPHLIQVTSETAGPGGGPMHAWAPEAYWDPTREQYAIVWSGNDASDVNRTYVSYTEDFVTIENPTPDVLFYPGYSEIDATIVQANGRNYLLYKDETGPGKDIQIARSSGAALSPDTFTRWDTDYITRGTSQGIQQYTEGPLVIKLPDEDRWYLYADYYGAGGVFGCWTTTNLDIDPSLWTKLDTFEYSLPSGVRHANTVGVTQAELDALIAHYGDTTDWSLLRSTYVQGSPFYVAHSWFHGIITNLDDRNKGQIESDFYWRVVPGLIDPTDPDLVSFEAVGFPGRYLRIDSENPNRYPSCPDNPANRSEGLCNYVPEELKNHLTWVDENDDSVVFRGDATFRRVSALNGDSSMVSFQWYQGPTRYLRHIGYQVFAHVPVTAEDNTDSSFTIESP